MGLEIRKKRWVIVLLLFLASVNNYLDRQTLSVLAPHLRDELGLSNVDYSFIVNAFLVAYAIMYAGSGRIIDLLGGRRGVSVCMLAWSMVSMLHATATGFLSLALYRFLLGLSEPGLYPGAVKVLSGLFAARDRGFVIGLVVCGTSVGAIIAPPVVVWLLVNFGWRPAFTVTGMSGLLIFAAWKLVYRSKAGEGATGEANATAESGAPFRWRELFSLPAVWAFMGVRVLGDPVWYFILFWLPDYLVKERGFSMNLIGKTAWIPYLGVDLGIVLGGLAAGALIRRDYRVLKARKAIAVLAAILVPFGILASLRVADPYAIVSLFAVAVFSMGLWMSTIHALPSDLFPLGNVASVYGLGGTAGAFGGIGFISLVGVLADSGLYVVTFWLASLMFPLSVLILAVFMRPLAPPAAANRN